MDLNMDTSEQLKDRGKRGRSESPEQELLGFEDFTAVNQRKLKKPKQTSTKTNSANGKSKADPTPKPSENVPAKGTQSPQSSHTIRNSTQMPTKTTNYSAKMNKIINKKFAHLFYLNTEEEMTRIEMAESWTRVSKKSEDIIIKTAKGFLLKTDTAKDNIITLLERLVAQGIISSFNETKDRTHLKEKTNDREASYVCVIASVEAVIDDASISQHLTANKVIHRYCKRIISKATNKPTGFIRIITGDISSFEKLLSEGMFYKHRHYGVYPSTPPPPAPLPCGKCASFEHTIEKCNTSPKCAKCESKHSTVNCNSNQVPKCTACKAEDHAAWSFKCPLRPTKPIPNIPNIPIKSINKKSADIQDESKLTSKIHTAVTKHDFIISTYINKLNSPTHANRKELLVKLKKKFTDLWNIDTTAIFTQNRLYILMFDMDNPGVSPTETSQGRQFSQLHE